MIHYLFLCHKIRLKVTRERSQNVDNIRVVTFTEQHIATFLIRTQNLHSYFLLIGGYFDLTASCAWVRSNSRSFIDVKSLFYLLKIETNRHYHYWCYNKQIATTKSLLDVVLRHNDDFLSVRLNTDWLLAFYGVGAIAFLRGVFRALPSRKILIFSRFSNLTATKWPIKTVRVTFRKLSVTVKWRVARSVSLYSVAVVGAPASVSFHC